MSMPQPYFVSRYSYYPAKIYDPMKKDYPIFHASHLEIEGGITSKSLQCDFGESFSTLTVFVLPCYHRVHVFHVISGVRDNINRIL